MEERIYIPRLGSPGANFITTKQRGPWASSSVVKALLIGMLGLAAIYGATRTETVVAIATPLLLLTGAFMLIAAWRDWEFGIQALLVVVILEGAVRKWFLPAASELVYFYKDFLMAVIVLSYLAKKRRPPFFIRQELKFFWVTLIAFALYAVAAISNASLPHPVVGLLGMKAYLLYVPLAFLVPRMFTTKEKLIDFLGWYSVIALPVVVLSVMQFADSDSTSVLNRYAWDANTISATGTEMGVANFQDSAGSTYVRVTGPFSFLSGLAIYLPVMFALLLGVISYRSRQPLPKGLRWIYHGSLAAVATAGFMTGSRGSVLNICLIAVIFYGFASKQDLLRRLRQAVAGGLLIIIALTIFFPQAFDAFYTRAFGGEEQVEEGQGRITEAFRLPFDEAGYAGAFGYGIGATQNATPILMRKLNLSITGDQIPIYYENESGRVMLELGVAGYLLHLLLRLSILAALFRACLYIRDPESKTLAVAAFAALVFPLVLGGAMSQHTQNVYQWFLIGIPFAMLNAEKLVNRSRTFAQAS